MTASKPADLPAPQPERLPTWDECLDEGAPILAGLFDKVYGPGRWRAPEPGETVAEQKKAS